jgi:hypothetical protein
MEEKNKELEELKQKNAELQKKIKKSSKPFKLKAVNPYTQEDDYEEEKEEIS